MNLSTTYLTLPLKNPLVAAASPLTVDLARARELQSAGVAAVVMHSVYEEAIITPQADGSSCRKCHGACKKAVSALSPAEYLRRIEALKGSLEIPVIASINASGAGDWTAYAPLIEEAGADALEINFYAFSTGVGTTAGQWEENLLEAVDTVCKLTSIPVAVKLLPFFSSLPHFVHRLHEAGAAGVVLFSRFYQEDIDPVGGVWAPRLHLSHMNDSSELRLRLGWVSMLRHHTGIGSIAATGGIRSGIDLLKVILAGAQVGQVASAFLSAGPQYAQTMLNGLTSGMQNLGLATVEDAHRRLARPAGVPTGADHRQQYMRVLEQWELRHTPMSGVGEYPQPAHDFRL